MSIALRSQADSLSNTSQLVRMHLVERKSVGDVVVEYLQKDRHNECFKLFWRKEEFSSKKMGKYKSLWCHGQVEIHPTTRF